MEYKDYYKTLGVARSASADEIKRAYRKLAREFHPDKNKAKGAEDKFKAINEANEVLSDPTKRAAYDQLGPNWQNGQRFTPPPGWANGGRSSPGDGGGFSDFFSTLFGAGGAPGGFEDHGFGGMGGASRDQRASLTISLEDSFRGATRTISLGARQLNVKIPAGVLPGQTVRLPGQAPCGGDVLLEVSIAPHPRFKLNGRDTSCTLNVAPWEAALGGTVPAPTLGGDVEVTLPPGTTGGRKLRLKGRGLPGTPPGDHFVSIQIVAPPAATEAQKQSYEQQRALFVAFDPRA